MGSVNTSKFRGKQQNLYSVARLAWGHCLRLIAAFAQKKAIYTATFVAAQVAKVGVAEALPDYANRKDIPSEARVALEAANLVVTDLWQMLKEYILDAFGADVVNSKLDAAGQGYYLQATGFMWDSTVSLINAAKYFMTANLTALTGDGNMPAGFPAEFAAAGTAFTLARTVYDEKVAEMEALTNDKGKADAEILKTLKPMLSLGKRIFKTDPVEYPNFVYDQLLDEVRGHQPAGVKGIMKDAVNGKGIANVLVQVLNSEISTLTDAKGRFDITLASGVYSFEISAAGYVTVLVANKKIEVGTKGRLSRSLERAVVPVQMVNNMMPVSPVPAPAPKVVSGNGVETNA